MLRKNWPEIMASVDRGNGHYASRPIILMLFNPNSSLCATAKRKWPHYFTDQEVERKALSEMRKCANQTARAQGKRARGRLVTFGATGDMPVFCFTTEDGQADPENGVHWIVDELKGANRVGAIYTARGNPMVLVQREKRKLWFVPAEYIDIAA